MQIPVIQGIYIDQASDFRIKYPHNLMPVVKDHGLSNGYLRPFDGVRVFDDVGNWGPGRDRASINWRDECYRVMGNSLVKILNNGQIVVINELINAIGVDQAFFDYSFDHLAIAVGKVLYLYDGTSLTQNTDSNLGDVLDVVYADGYFVTTDGEYIVVTELGDPFTVNNLKYGSSELDPDPIVGVMRIRNELWAINRHTMECFYNAGSEFFPFARVDGSRIMKGAVGTAAKCELDGMIAFLGGGRNEPVSVWLGANSQTTKIATYDIDLILRQYSEETLSKAVLQSHLFRGQYQLWVRLPDIILIYDATASQVSGAPVWFTIDPNINNPVFCYDKWIVSDDFGRVGYLDGSIATRYGDTTEWSFQTKLQYNEGKGSIIHNLELVAITGNTPTENDPTIWTNYSLDGVTWSDEKMVSAGRIGQRQKRLCWRRQGFFRNFRVQRFRGNSDGLVSIARLEAEVERLAY